MTLLRQARHMPTFFRRSKGFGDNVARIPCSALLSQIPPFVLNGRMITGREVVKLVHGQLEEDQCIWESWRWTRLAY